MKGKIVRIDTTLRASTSFERPLPLPLLENWQHWVEKLGEELEPLLPDGNNSEDDEGSLAWRGDPEALIIFGTHGQISSTSKPAIMAGNHSATPMGSSG